MAFQILIKEENKKLPVSKYRLEAITHCAFMLTKKREKDISLVVCDDPFIQKLNKKYRKRDFPTDVLSFSLDEGTEPHLESPILGDIVISVETAQQQATAFGETLEKEFYILYIHGMLHLLGYTHNNQEEDTIMSRITSQILSEVP